MFWIFVFLVSAGLLLFIKFMLVISYCKSTMSGGQLFAITFFFLLSLTAIGGAFVGLFTYSRQGDTALMSANETLILENDSLRVRINDLKDQFFASNQAVQPFNEFARQKYKALSSDEALRKLATDLPQMEAAVKKTRPYLEYLGDSTRLSGHDGIAYYFNTYYFTARNATLKNIKVKIKTSEKILQVTSRTRGRNSQDDVGRTNINKNRKGFSFALNSLPRGYELLITVKSEILIESESIDWSPN